MLSLFWGCYVECPSIDLEVPLVAGLVGDDAVDDTASVTEQVESLLRSPHHPEIETIVRYERFDGADPGIAVRPQGPEKDQAHPVDPLLGQPPELGGLRYELSPRCHLTLPPRSSGISPMAR